MNAAPTKSPRLCPECGAEVKRQNAKGAAPTFCSPAHKTAYHSRAMGHGRALLPLLKAWRVSRHRKDEKEIGSAAFKEICSMVDAMIAEDRAAGRPRPTLYAERLLKNGRYIDRRG